MLRYHAKLTGGPWEAVQNAVMGSRMSKQNQENGFFSCAHQGSTPHAAPNPGRSEQAYPNKERFGRGIQFCCWVLQHFFTRGAAVDQILGISLLSTKICPRTQCEDEAMQNSTCKESFNISLTPLRTTTTTTTTTTSKIWPLARGFLPYKRESNEYKSY